MLHHTDPKKYPKKPDFLWNPNAGDQSIDQMKALALAWASNGPEIAKQK